MTSTFAWLTHSLVTSVHCVLHSSRGETEAAVNRELGAGVT
jgi:hypothetical protein